MNWNEYAIRIAEVVAMKSKDPWRKVGCVLLRHDNSIASVGYNGFPAGAKEDWTDRDRRRDYVIHAEQNALRYVNPNECRLIAATLLPCNNCLKAIASYGIKEIIYKDPYELDDSTLSIASEFAIKLTQIN